LQEGHAQLVDFIVALGLMNEWIRVSLVGESANFRLPPSHVRMNNFNLEYSKLKMQGGLE
jgi:hypothetical protein